jgi:hypothetical protein
MELGIRLDHAAEEHPSADDERGEAGDERHGIVAAPIGWVREHWSEDRGHRRSLRASRATRIGRTLHFLPRSWPGGIGKVPYEAR